MSFRKGNGKINANGWLQSYAAGGNTGTVSIDATGDIKTDLISNVASNGTAGNVVVKSTAGAIQTGAIETFTFGGGNAGTISLMANKDIISTGSIAAGTPSGKNGAKIELISTTGKIDTNGQDINSISWYGIGGAITLSADKDINVGAVYNQDNVATAGVKDISLTSKNGNITAKWLRSDSLNGVGGSIKLDAQNGFIRIVDHTEVSNVQYSILSGKQSTLSGNGEVISIKHKGGSTRTPFSVGDSSINGTQEAISSSKVGLFPIESPIRFLEDFSLGNLDIDTQEIVFPADLPKIASSLFGVLSNIDYKFKYISNPDPNKSDAFLPDSLLIPNNYYSPFEWTVPSYLVAENPVLTTLISTLTVRSKGTALVREFQNLTIFDAFAASGAAFMSLVDPGTIILFETNKGYPAVRGTLRGGGTVRWRPVSTSGEPTVDVEKHNTPGVDPVTGNEYSVVKEIKFVYPKQEPSPFIVPKPSQPPNPKNDFIPFIPFFPGLRLPDESIWNGV